MSLRLQINLLLAGVIVVFTVVVLAFELTDTRRSVREETEAANRVATQLLGYFVNTYAKTSTPIVLESLERLGRVRSTEITLRDDAGNEVYHSPPSPYKAGRDAPAWYAALVAPEPMKSELRFYDSVLTIEANASRAVLDGWDDTVTLLEVGACVLVFGNLLVFWLVRRATQPFRAIERGLEDVERGAFHTRLPTLAGAEAGKIALAFNRMAAAVEDNLNARAEAADARMRLEQSRELADVVQARIEDERAHIARELHDEMGQNLTAIRSLALSLSRRESHVDSTTLSDSTRQADSTTQQTAQLIADTAAKLYAAMHELIPRLRPLTLDSLELADAATERVAEWRRLHPDVAFALEFGPLPEDLGESYKLAAYRILQEAVTNALRHADARTIAIRIGSDMHALLLDVVDDGRGLPQDWQRPGHFGVRGMRERARALGGEIEIENRHEGGTRVHARLPLT
ncbi:MAG TPA: ATP-binding protein [Rhodanobacteraceae bacterium]|jgi:two-component system sensor histidine kinase UhpB|nr:ATP-binding protein [Rhodanobacteraceae bacterium]